MDINVRRVDQKCIVSIIGSIDALTAELITECLNKRVENREKNIVLDLTEVDFMSSAGLRCILGALKETRKIGGDLCIAGAQPRVARVLNLSGFSNLLRDYATVDEAVELFAV